MKTFKKFIEGKDDFRPTGVPHYAAPGTRLSKLNYSDQSTRFMPSFNEWIYKNDEKLYQEMFGGLGRLAKKAVLPLATASAMAVGTHEAPKAPEAIQHKQSIVQQKNSLKQNEMLVFALNAKYKTNLTANQVKMIKPIDVIKPMYGNQWDSVYKKAKENQGKRKIGEMDIEGPDDSGVTNLSKLEIPVPVIFADPKDFGVKNANGFCTMIYVNGQWEKFCVVRNETMLSTIRHELSHTTQDLIGSISLGGEGDFGDYEMDEAEIGVRIAEMKRNYYELTGEIATSDRDSFMGMIKHFYKYTPRYSQDVQQLKITIDKAKKQGLLEKLINYMKDNIDKMVKKDSQNTHANV